MKVGCLLAVLGFVHSFTPGCSLSVSTQEHTHFPYQRDIVQQQHAAPNVISGISWNKEYRHGKGRSRIVTRLRAGGQGKAAVLTGEAAVEAQGQAVVKVMRSTAIAWMVVSALDAISFLSLTYRPMIEVLGGVLKCFAKGFLGILLLKTSTHFEEVVTDADRDDKTAVGALLTAGFLFWRSASLFCVLQAGLVLVQNGLHGVATGVTLFGLLTLVATIQYSRFRFIKRVMPAEKSTFLIQGVQRAQRNTSWALFLVYIVHLSILLAQVYVSRRWLMLVRLIPVSEDAMLALLVRNVRISLRQAMAETGPDVFDNEHQLALSKLFQSQKELFSELRKTTVIYGVLKVVNAIIAVRAALRMRSFTGTV